MIHLNRKEKIEVLAYVALILSGLALIVEGLR